MNSENSSRTVWSSCGGVTVGHRGVPLFGLSWSHGGSEGCSTVWSVAGSRWVRECFTVWSVVELRWVRAVFHCLVCSKVRVGQGVFHCLVCSGVTVGQRGVSLFGL